MTRTLCQQQYWKQKRSAKGLLRQYIASMTGLSRAQVTRLIARYQKDGQVKERELSAATGSPAATQQPILNCWQRWMKRTKH